MATKKRAARNPKSARPKARLASRVPVPPKIFAVASPHSVGGVSMFEAQSQITAETVPHFVSDPDATQRAVSALHEAGFEVLQVSPTAINIAAPKSVYEKAFQTTIEPDERPVIKEFATESTATFWDSPDTEINGLVATTGTAFENLLEGVAIEEPRYFMGPSMFAPLQTYWHLRLPGDVSLALNADRAHRTGITGRGVKVAMVDSGWFKHPYFVGRGYNVATVTLGPGAADPLADESGHGTGESANIFAAAPDVQLLPVKMNFVNSIGAFNAAVGLGPDIITCSWGSSVQNGPLSAADQALAAAIATAVASGIIVIFSAGNGHFGFPGQHPDVISAGGTYMKPDETLMASNYASGFASAIYAGRNVPDVCGLVGMLPKAIYLMLPLQPGDEIDVGNGGGTFPNGDQTTKNDGWGAFSGTSAAAPQLAGVAALVKQACSRLSPTAVRDILIKSARDVTTGTCNAVTGGHAATVGPDLATGAGLVDAHKATLLAKVRCLRGGIAIEPPIGIEPPIRPPIEPPIRPPIEPPIRPPIRPIQPIQPIAPIRPIQPIQPIRPIQPIAPIRPIEPIRPIRPIEPIRPGETMAGELDAPARSSLAAEDVDALEEMIINSDKDPTRE